MVNLIFINIKQVGLHAEHGYARSLALFVADLGPVVWKIASKKIENISRELGRVLIQEIEMLQQQRVFPVDGGSSVMKTVAESKGILPCISTSGSNICIANCGEDSEIDRVRNSPSRTTLLDRSRGVIGSTTCIPNEEKTLIPSNIHLANGDCFPHFSQEKRMARLDANSGGASCSGDSSVPCLVRCTSPALNNASFQIPAGAGDIDLLRQAEMSKPAEDGIQSQSLRHSPARAYFQESIETQEEEGLGERARWQELSTHPVLDSIPFNPDLNFGLGLSAAPTSNLQILSQIQPDLVLQL